MKKGITKAGFLLFAFIFSFANMFADAPTFVVVLDAGHGGHDPGAIGAMSQEKKINLEVELALGQLIEKNDPNVKVIYSRKTDKYLTLQERADVANNAHADLFICIHTNSSPSSAAAGAETYTLGLTKSKSNLDVAMRENSVILLEDNYKVKYEGFNPNSVDSYIMFECIQDKYLDKSVQIASDIQKSFVNSGRKDRGVRQAGFWVLHKTAMPSILVEVGYISNPEEEQFLNSNVGQQKIAGAIYQSFERFKKEYERKSGKQNYVMTDQPDAAVVESLKVNVDTQRVAMETVKSTPTSATVKHRNGEKSKKSKTEPVLTDEQQTQQFLDKMKAEAHVVDEKPKAKASKKESKKTEVIPETKKQDITANAPKAEVKPEVITPAKTKDVVTVSKVEAKKPSVTTNPKKMEEVSVSSTKTDISPLPVKSKGKTTPSKVETKSGTATADVTTVSPKPQTVTNASTKINAKKTEVSTLPNKTANMVTPSKSETKSQSKKKADLTAESNKIEPEVVSTKTELKGTGKKQDGAIQSKRTGITTTAKVENKPETKKVEQTQSSMDGVVFKLQLFALSKKQSPKSPVFKGLKVDMFEDGGLFKYTYGSSTDYTKIQKTKEQIAAKFPDAIIIATKDGKKVPIQDVLK